MRSADSSSQLMQLRQAEFVGTMHDNSVGVRDVNTSLNNRGAEQDVGSLSIEVTHYLFQFSLVHLAVSYVDTSFRNKFLKLVETVLDRFHFIVKEVDLTAAFQFT